MKYNARGLNPANSTGMTGILGKNKLFEQNLSKMLNMNFRGSRAEVGRDGSVEKGFEVKG